LNGLPFVFANPWGALALLGLPTVVAIHCLQQKSRALRVSTLFLLERLASDSREGRRFTWLRSSLPFWLQILCVLIATWILLQPRWLQANAAQRVVVVLDSSISMRAFTGDIAARTSSRLRALAALTPRTDWTLLETDPAHPTLYEGNDLAALERKLRDWSSSLPAHDPSRALQLARSLAARDALVIFVTDRNHDVPAGVDLLAIGEPIENCRLVGSRILGEGDNLEWQVVAQNYGQKTAHRSWWIALAGKETERQEIDLEPGHPRILKGKFPPGLNRLEVCLEADRFTIDDRMAFVRPQPKRLAVDLHGDEATTDLFIRLTQTLPALAVGSPADLAFVTINPRVPVPQNARATVVLLNDPLAKEGLTGGPYVAENDPLNRDLNWQGLIIQSGLALPPAPDDRVLLWKDRAPLIFVRTSTDARRQLVFNFNFPASNATRLPAFVLLIDRFIETVRAEKKAPEAINTELAEEIAVAADPAGGPVVLHDSIGGETSVASRSITTLCAPSLPGFFSVTQGNKMLLAGAVHFADARDSDFSAATSIDTLASRRAKLVETRARAETATPLWLVLIGLLLILNWRLTSPRIA